MEENRMDEYNIPKVIYLTYKNKPPDYVFKRWQNLNPDYKIELSLDKDCIVFLTKFFGSKIANLFCTINVGMYKADLWRICKLYIHGGVYADIDLVPHVSVDSLIKKKYTFYSCLSIDPNSIFQAFIITPPKNPLLLSFIFSFIKNKPYNYNNGPTFDMYNCIQYQTNVDKIQAETVYHIDKVKITIEIGSSIGKIKIIPLYNFSITNNYSFQLVKNIHPDNFHFKVVNNCLIVTRTDTNGGWDYNHSVDILIESNQQIFLFKELRGSDGSWVTAYVKYKNKKILDSRDMEYFKKKEQGEVYK
jgi:hypothetical protein